MYPVISKNPYIQTMYEAMRNEGTSHNLAEMFALQQPPQQGGTDSAFMEGHCNGNQFEGQEHIGDYYKATATAAGVDTKGKVYLSQLATFPGDPKAWVSGRGDVQKVCEERGWGCQGSVRVAAQGLDSPPPPPPRMDPALVNAKVTEIINNPDIVPPDKVHEVDLTDLREQIIEKHGAPKGYAE